MELTNSDYIAIAAFVISFLSAYYTRQARDEARRANKIAVHESLRPLRLAVFQSMTLFAQYCSNYVTMHHMKAVNGTRDLVARIDTFKWEVGQHGDLAMPDVEAKAQEFINGAWRMQRLLDRIAGGQSAPLEPVYSTAQENLDASVDWFGEQERELKEVFRPYQAEA